jgi:nucleolar MIF4G domain-containing protein 1
MNDRANLYIIQPVDFMKLKLQTRDFFKELFIHIFINSQRSTPLANSTNKDLVFTRNRNAIEEIFNKVSRVEVLGMGLVFLLSELFPKKQRDDDDDDGFSKFLKWAVGVAKDTLRTVNGIDPIP